MSSYQEKCEQLENMMDNYLHEDVMVAFSGGVDSSVILELACKYGKKHGTKVYATTIQTTLHPSGEAAEAKLVADKVGAIHKIVKVDELESAGIENNPKDRCYRCKKYMFSEALLLAKECNATYVFDGTNADDTKVYRPGIRALKELGVISPLMLCDFTKEEVRKLAEEYHVSSAKKPSTPCMATRFPYDTKLSYEELHKAEEIETVIRNMGFYNVRARIHDKLVRIEVDQKDIQKLLQETSKMVNFVKSLGYHYVSVDMEGFRSGSQDIDITTK